MNATGIPRPVVFDLYGTLVDTASVTAVCERLFPGRGAALSNTWRARQLEYTWLLNSMGDYLDFAEVTRRALKFSCRSARLPCGPGDESALMEAYLDLAPFEDAAPATLALAERGSRLLVLTNGTLHMAEEVLRRAGLAGVISEVLSADSVGVYKPDPRVYRAATVSLDLPGDQITFVSGNGWDVAGAARFGLRTIWVNRSGDVADEIGHPAQMEISSLTELAEAVCDDDR